MANPTPPPDKCRALLAVLCVLYTHAVFCNFMQLLPCLICRRPVPHSKEATALETAVRKTGDDHSAAYVDTDGAHIVALQAELDAAKENDDIDAVEAVAAVAVLNLVPFLDDQAAAVTAAAAAAVYTHSSSWPPGRADPHRRRASMRCRAARDASVRLPTFGTGRQSLSLYIYICKSISPCLYLDVCIPLIISRFWSISLL